MRADIYLFQHGYAKSRQKARELIKNDCVKINLQKISKPSYEIDETGNIRIEINEFCPFVSRGGLKLDKILNEAQINVSDMIAVDIGASTGGFTDCLLKRGVTRVYAVDSGHGQLDEKLISDSRVISIEGFNARNINSGIVPEKVDLITADVSFISQTYIMPSAIELLKDGGIYIGLIKPQFEVGKTNISKGGIVKDKKVRYSAVKRVIDCAGKSLFVPVFFIKSPISGGDGNTEYLCIFAKNSIEMDENLIKKIVLDI